MSRDVITSREERMLRVALGAAQIPSLKICQAIASTGSAVVRFDDLVSMLRPRPTQTVLDFSIVQVAIAWAAEKGLIRDPGHTGADNKYQHAYELTDAGRFHLQTAVTGSTARGILAEIEAEETAGQA